MRGWELVFNEQDQEIIRHARAMLAMDRKYRHRLPEASTLRLIGSMSELLDAAGVPEDREDAPMLYDIAMCNEETDDNPG